MSEKEQPKKPAEPQAEMSLIEVEKIIGSYLSTRQQKEFTALFQQVRREFAEKVIARIELGKSTNNCEAAYLLKLERNNAIGNTVAHIRAMAEEE